MLTCRAARDLPTANLQTSGCSAISPRFAMPSTRLPRDATIQFFFFGECQCVVGAPSSPPNYPNSLMAQLDHHRQQHQPKQPWQADRAEEKVRPLPLSLSHIKLPKAVASPCCWCLGVGVGEWTGVGVGRKVVQRSEVWGLTGKANQVRDHVERTAQRAHR